MLRNVTIFHHDTRRKCFCGKRRRGSAIELIVVINLVYTLHWFMGGSVLTVTEPDFIASKPQVDTLVRSPLSQFQQSNMMTSIFPQSLTDYIKWHSHMRLCMSSDFCSKERPKIILWKCPNGTSIACAGVGDRFRALHFSLLLAIVSKRMLFIDWPDQPFPFELAVVPALIDWRLPSEIESRTWPIFSHDQWPLLESNSTSKNHLKESGSQSTLLQVPEEIPTNTRIDLSKACIQSELKTDPDFVLYSRATPTSTLKLARNNKTMKSFEDLQIVGGLFLQRSLLNALFSPSQFVKSEIEKHLYVLRQKSYVSVHVRTGFDIGEIAHARFRNLPRKTECITKLAKSIFDQIYPVSKLHPIFITSDSTPLKKAIRIECEKRLIPVTYSSSPAFHVGRKWGFPKNLNGTEKWRAFLNVFVDFFGIAGGTEIFGNGSGFSYLAYIYGNATMYRTLKMEQKFKR